MPFSQTGAQGASRRRTTGSRVSRSRLAPTRSIVLLGLLALSLALPATVAGSSAAPGTQPGVLTVGPAAAALAPGAGSVPVPASVRAAVTPTVAIVVGPVGGYTTARYIRMARRLAAVARERGARVIEVYSPNATWERVRDAADGANVLIYLGHGNGWPSRFGPYDASRHEGLGLNAAAGNGNSNTRYYGGARVAEGLRLAPGAVVILNHLCYASGNNEWGRGNPTRSVAMRRADGFASGFLRAGASAVIAEGIDEPSYVLRALLSGQARSAREIFWSSPYATERYALAFTSRRTTGATVLMDPYAPSRYYRSIVGDLDAPLSAWGPLSSWAATADVAPAPDAPAPDAPVSTVTDGTAAP